MRTLENSLNMLSLSNDFTVERIESENEPVEYKISDKKSDLVAFWQNGEFEFFVSGVYNSGVNFAQIDYGRLCELVKFCSYLSEFSGGDHADS